MRRAVILISIALGAVALLLAVLAAFAVSPPGRDMMASIAERRIATITGGEAEIGELRGGLSRRIELHDVRLIGDGAEWARVRRITLIWSPEALLSRRIEIREIVFEDADLLARPPARERTAPFKGLEIPARLPAVAIGRIELRNLQVSKALVGEPLRLDGDGAVKMGGAALSVTARIKDAGGRDDLSIDVIREGNSVAPELTVRIASAADGAIAALLNAGDAVALNVKGKGQLSDYQVIIDGKAGAYGAFSGALSGDLATIDAFRFEVTASPGVRFDRWRADFGDRLAAAGALFPADRGGRLEISTLSGAFGEISGVIEWRNGAKALDAAVVDLAAQFSPTWRADLQEVTGEKAEAHLVLEKKGRGYAGTASAVTPALSVELTEIETDLRASVSGMLAAMMREDSAFLAPLGVMVRGQGEFSFAAGEAIELKSFEVAAGDGASVKGDASYKLAERQFSVTGDILASAAAIKAIAPAVTPRGGASGSVTASGAFEDFNLDFAVTAPGFMLGGSNWPAARISAALSKMPASPGGAISVRAADGSIRSSVEVRRDEAGALTFSNIDHRGTGFALTGEASFNPQTQEGAVDLRYAGEDGAEPWPGMAVAGAFSAKGALDRRRADNRIDFNAPSLRLQSLALENAMLTGQGPFEGLSFKGSADALSVRDQVRLEGLKIAGAAAIGEKTVITVASAAAEVQGAKARLERSLNITLGGGVAVDGLSLRIGETGSISASGALEPTRWRMDAKIRDLEISGNGSTVDFDLAMDTNESRMAAGAFSAASGRLGEADATLKGTFSWDGRRLSLAAGGEDSALDLDLDMPLSLRRDESLRIGVSGALRGTALYKGRAETIAVFLPRALQTLEGDLAFNGALGGSMKDPRLSGALSLTDGAYTEAISGLSIVDIDLTSSASASSAASFVTFDATASGAGQTAKTVTAAGRIDLGGDVAVSAVIALDGARFAAGPVQRVDASGTLKVEGAADNLLLSGDIAIGALEAKLFTPERVGLVDIDVVAVGSDGSQIAKVASPRNRSALRYAVSIAADDNIAVNGRGLDSEWRANAQISGTSAQPLILGTMNLNRGDLEFAGRRFNLTRGSIGFDTLAPNDPTISLRAERESRDGATVAVVITGRSSALRVSLESTPSRPSEDVMALILFDKPAQELSAFESLQVADALTQLGGVGAFGGKGVTGAARDALGLDLLNLNVDQADSSESLLTVGKYVTDGLFVSASQNARGENGSLRIEYEVGQSFSVETELRQDGDQTISANWKKDF